MNKQQKTVIVAPLNWGIGHATRCIPVIRQLIEEACRVIIAGDGESLEVLKTVFPSLKYYSLPAYNARYPEDGQMVWAMARQFPGLLRTIAAEQRAIEQVVEAEQAQLVISDNRYGCFSKKVPSVIICHQLNLQMPHRWMQSPVNYLNHFLLSRFNEVWVPDNTDRQLTGVLTESGQLKVIYIGILSSLPQVQAADGEPYVLGLVSGPEPQRSILIDILSQQMKHYGKAARLVMGKPLSRGHHQVSGAYEEIAYASGMPLAGLIKGASLVLSRPGYSTMMDLAALGARSVFIPTPGQTEQEYLARRAEELGIAPFMLQRDFNLTNALKLAVNYQGFINFERNSEALLKAIKAWI